MGSVPRQICGALPELEQRLAEMIAELQQQNPLGRITILVTNTMLAPYLRQRLAGYGRGHINVQIITSARLAEKLAASSLAEEHQRPMPQMGDRVLSRRIAEQTETRYFSQVARSPGFADTLRGLIRELSQAGIRSGDFSNAVLDLGPMPTEKLSDLAALYRRYDQARARFYNVEDAYHHLDPSNDIRQVVGNAVLCYGMWRLTGNQRTLIDTVLRADVPVTFFLPDTETDADLAHAELREWLAARQADVEHLPPNDELGDGSSSDVGSLRHLQRALFHPADSLAPADGAVQLLSAPDAVREVREAARACLKWSRELGIPFHRMAVVYRQADPYRVLIDQIFRGAGISVYLHSGRPLIERPAGQRLVTLLNLIDADLPRSAVMEFFTETILPRTTLAEFEDEDAPPIHPARWDQISREAGIVEGRDQWLSRLDLLRRGKQEFVQPDDEDQNDRILRELGEIERLRRFVERFADDLAQVKDRAPWSAHLSTLSTIARRYIDGIDDLLDRLNELAALDDLDDAVSFDRFRETVRFWLARQDSAAVENGNGNGADIENGPPPGQFGRRGVNVFDVGSLRHLQFDAVVILGVAERQFPSPPRQDPLLLDRERSRLNEQFNWTLPIRAFGTDDEALTFAMAVSAARKRLQISYPRTESGGSRSYLPSHFFRATAAALTGEEVEASKIDRISDDFYRRVPSGRFGTDDGTIPLDAHEYDRAVLEADRELGLELVKRWRPAVDRADTADRKRRSAAFTEFDGWIGPDLATSIAMTAGKRRRAISPSRLETFATCPFRFFMQYALRLEKVEEPELLERIGAMERGSLIHEVLERFLTRLADRGDLPAPDRRDAHLDLLRDIATDAFGELEEQGLVGYRVLWEYERIAILEDLEEWYDHEARDLNYRQLRPETFELRFGWSRTPGDGGKHSRDEPYTYQLQDGGEFSFQGRVDRVDIDPMGHRFRVIDYKSGRSGYYKENTFSGGRSVQLPIYLLATADLLGIPWKSSVAEYFFPTRRGEFKRVQMDGFWFAENQDAFSDLLSGISDAIEQGVFPQVPSIERERRDNCKFCDVRDVCPANVERIADRKKSQPKVARLRQVIEAE